MRILEYVRLPFKREIGSGSIVDLDGRLVVDVRGWNFIKHIDKPSELIESLRDFVIKAMNNYTRLMENNKLLEEEIKVYAQAKEEFQAKNLTLEELILFRKLVMRNRELASLMTYTEFGYSESIELLHKLDKIIG